jgi:hypothetical protein
MKLVVLVPSQDYLIYAGARIRYGRIAPATAALGTEIELMEIGQFDPDASGYDAILVSKCHDARSLVAAMAASDRGKLVGIDLFDDYFSDRHDARLVRYRNWLAQIVRLCDFALCSTGAMADVLGSYRPDLPVHILNDPAPVQKARDLGAVLDGKAAGALEERCIRATWYGVGDNAFFDAGLSDLAAHGDDLAALASRGFAVELTVLTNSRSLTARRLGLLSRLPVSPRIIEWSEAAEREALEEALVAILPVNASSFSAAKSLNRGFTALASGCQLLSTAYPLYDALDPLIYRDAEDLLDDLEAGALRLGARSLGLYRQLLERFGDAEVEADGLHRFLQPLTAAVERPAGIAALIHGRSVNAEAHRLVQEIGGLSVASPFATAPIPFDIIFQGGPGRLDMLVAKRVAQRLKSAAADRARGIRQVRGVPYLVVAQAGGVAIPRETEDGAAGVPLAMQLATYGATMSALQRQLGEAFGPCRPILLENSQIPFPFLQDEDVG